MACHSNSSATLPQSATLDERIRGLYPPGAVYKKSVDTFDTVVEQSMRRMSSFTRARPGWIEALGDADSRASWAREAKEMGLTDLELWYVLDELTYYASLSQPGSNIRLSAVDGVWISDSLVDLETTDRLKDYAAILERVPSFQKDYWHPNSKNRVLNLIDPSLYPLVYSRSKLLRQPSASPQASLTVNAAGEFPGAHDFVLPEVTPEEPEPSVPIGASETTWSNLTKDQRRLFRSRPREAPKPIDKWRGTLNDTDSSNGSGYYIPTNPAKCGSYASKDFSWLPSEFSVDCDGSVEITSYINNLHPVKHAALYPVIGSIFSKFLPLLAQVVTDIVHPRGERLMDWPDSYYKSDESMPLDNDTGDCYEEVREWKRYAEFVHPQPKPFVTPERPITPYTLCGRQLQAVVKMSNIELAPNCPRYHGDDWSVAAQANERIIATGVYYYDVSNISRCSLQLREQTCGHSFSVEQFDLRAVIELYGIDDPHDDDLRLAQTYGDIGIKDGLCVVYPSIYQHQIPEFKLADSSKPGHCKMLTFYFVDPATRIPSTAIVPPQQQEWWFEDVLASEPFCNLPLLILDGIIHKIDFPISPDEARRIRKELAVDLGKCNDDASFELFEPPFHFSS